MTLPHFLARDLALTAVVVSGWWWLWPVSIDHGPLADLVGVILGLGAGAVAFVAHEWGHLVGALLSGGRFALPAKLSSPFLFSFDSRGNSQRQFLLMSLSGFAVSALALLIAYGWLPPQALATRVARGLALLQGSLTALLEVPLLIVSLAKGSILEQAEVFPVSTEPRPSYSVNPPSTTSSTPVT